MATVSTGGFSTKNTSLAYWNHLPLVQYVVILFMIVAGTNFILTYFALKGKVRKVIQSEEFRYYIFGILGITIIVSSIILFFKRP